MRPALYLVSILLLIPAALAEAGPWLREKGAGFAAFSYRLDRDRSSETSSYIEYGLGDATTLGLDLGLSQFQDQPDQGRALIFLRQPLTLAPEKGKLAYELGLGNRLEQRRNSPHIKSALTWGKGINFRGRDGWLTSDAALLWDLGSSYNVAKIDTSLGLHFSDHFAGLLQLNLEYAKGKTQATVLPSLLIKSPKRKLTVQFGLDSPLDDLDATRLVIGLWRDF